MVGSAGQLRQQTWCSISDGLQDANALHHWHAGHMAWSSQSGCLLQVMILNGEASIQGRDIADHHVRHSADLNADMPGQSGVTFVIYVWLGLFGKD